MAFEIAPFGPVGQEYELGSGQEVRKSEIIFIDMPYKNSAFLFAFE